MKIRILSGVHQDAEIDISAAGLRIGYGDGCDIELLDLGTHVCAHIRYDQETDLFTVSDEANFSWLTNLSGEVLHNRQALNAAFLFLGPVIIYLGVPVFDQNFTIPESIQKKHQKYQTRTEEAAEPVESFGAQPTIDTASNHPHAIEHRQPTVPSRPVSAAVWVALFGCLSLMIILAFVMLTPSAPLLLAKPIQPVLASGDPQTASAGGVEASGGEGVGAEVTPEFTETDNAVRWLAKAFDEARLSQYLEVSQSGNQIKLRGALSEKDTEIFEGVINDWQQQFGQRIGFTAELKKPINELPFKIREVNPGPQGWIVTSENQIIYIGGVYQGFRLDKVERNRLLFGGKASLDITL